LLATWFVLAPMFVDMLFQSDPQHSTWVWLAVYFSDISDSSPPYYGSSIDFARALGGRT